MTDHLKEAKTYADRAQTAGDLNYAQLNATAAIGHALIALVERLDAPAPKSRVAAYDWSAYMDEVAERIGQRVRACPYHTGEECSC
jgi:hypothetical protein